MIPDDAKLCPHCRVGQRRGDLIPQTVLAVAAAGASAIVAIESCPAALGLEPAAVAVAHSEGAAERRSVEPLTIARLRYDGGGDWYANPSSLDNLLREIARRTGLRTAPRPAEVRPSDPDLADYPYLYATGHGNMAFSALEVERLRAYLRGGGFLHVDDNYGLDESFRREVGRLFPDDPLTEVPLDHPVYRLFYEFPEGLPKIHEHDGKPAQGFGVFLDGRLAVFYSYESDLGDGWEDEGVHDDPPQVREQAYRMGVNLFLYALSATPRP